MVVASVYENIWSTIIDIVVDAIVVESLELVESINCEAILKSLNRTYRAIIS